MVNLTETKSENPSSNSSFSNLFSLSRPVNLFEEKFEKTKNLILKLNSQSSLRFEFIEPFESSHAKSQTSGGKQVTNKLSSNRAKPYTLSKPDKHNEQPAIETSSNYHQTAILARLSSISSTFKSIFVRPKNTKHIDLDSIKIKNKNQPATGDFKIKLFSTGGTDQNSSILNQKIEKIISKNIDTCSAKNSTSSNSSVVSTLSTTSNLTSDSFLNTTKVTTVKSGASLASKWTCMVCLSKHKMEVKVCSICGSQKHNQKVSIKQTNTNTLKTIQNQTNSNYLKTWTCSYCSYANDSLKIVCMNCRSSKQIKKDHQAYHRVQLKRSRNQDSDKQLNTSNEENQFEHGSVKKSRQEKQQDWSVENNTKPCMCKCNQEVSNDKNESKLEKEQTNNVTSTNKSSLVIENKTDNLITPTKPSNFYNTSNNKPLMTAPLAAKWTCSVCLVSNDQDKNFCVCCTSTREIVKQDKKLDKWKCQVCLVQNDSDKDSCVCCTTSRSDKPSSTTTENAKTKFSELVAAAGSITNQIGLTSVNTNISFGLKSNDQASTKPICFTSSFSLSDEKKQNNVGFSHDNIKVQDSSQNGNLCTQFGASEPTKVISNSQNCLSNETSKKSTLQNENNQISFKTNQTNNFSFLNPSQKDEPPKQPSTNNLFSFGSNQSTNNSTTTSSCPLFSASTDQQPQANTITSTATSFFGSNATETKPSFAFGSNETSKEATSLFCNSSNQPQSTFSFGSCNKPFGLTSNDTSKPLSTTKQTTGLFGSSTSTVDSKPAFGSFASLNQPSTSETTSAPVAKQSSNLFSSICSESKPSTFSFGNNEASNSNQNKTTQENQPSFLFSNTNAQTPKATSLFTFGASNTDANKTTANNCLFGSSSSDSKAAFSFANTQCVNEPSKPAFSFGNSEAPKPSFVFSASTTTTTPMGTETKPSGQPYVFGGGQSQNQIAKETHAPFNFGSSNSNFNFGSTANSFGTCSTPSTKSAFGTSAADVAPSTPNTTMTPFAFGATGLNQQNNVDSPSLSQVLSAQTTPSTRVIKKPTRRLKK